jgi:hypothetical protein
MKRRGLLTGAVATVRRRREDRAPRVRLYDAAGTARALDPGSEQGAALLAAAERAVEVARSREQREDR